jgi:hypothetical protein
MDKNSKLQLKEIYNTVLYMTFSDDNFLDIIYYLDVAINIAKQENPDAWINSCLNNLLQTKEKQLSYMMSNYENKEEREVNFIDLKENFLIDLSFNCNCLEFE